MNFVIFSLLLLVLATAVRAFSEDLDDDENLGHSGDFQKTDINSPEINELARKLVAKQYVADSESSCPQKLNRVLKAQTKVIAGQLVTMELEICPDTCNNGIIKISECKICTVEAWEKTWEDFLQISKFDCSK